MSGKRKGTRALKWRKWQVGLGGRRKRTKMKTRAIADLNAIGLLE